MAERYSPAAELARVTASIDAQLEDETASRQYIAEEASARVKNIALALRAVPVLDDAELDTLRLALADAIEVRRERASRSIRAEHAGHVDAIPLYRDLGRLFGIDAGQ